MRKYRFLPLFFLLFIALATPACKTKEGCEATESLKPKLNRKGEVKKSSKSQSGLFPKKMQKKMRH
jgi:hypothetical protein